ncbi:hypothetical protein KP509_31G066800 [Ceratopteris richardii]|nr:hypothetical protein KP509_31G066800 [Ceratopteris richardii]
MHAKFGELGRAWDMIMAHDIKDTNAWAAVVAGYAEIGQNWHALRSLKQMRQKGLSPEPKTFACALKACGNVGAVHEGMHIHTEITRQGNLQKDVMVGTALLHMYAKFGNLGKAQCILNEMPHRNVITWGILIGEYVKYGQVEKALKSLEDMQYDGVAPNARIFTSILKACATLRDVEKGQVVHDKIARRGMLNGNVVLGNALMDMYVKCGALDKAKLVLEGLSAQDVITWNTLIAGYSEAGQGEQALACLECMQSKGFIPDAVTYASALKACGSLRAIERGLRIHVQLGRLMLLHNDEVLNTALVDMYVKCGDLVRAQNVLDGLPSRNVFCWSALIAGYAHQGHGEEAWNCFERMQYEGIIPNVVTFVCMVKACGILGALDKGMQIHEEIKKKDMLGNNIVLGNALVDMYAKCGALAMAQQVLEELPLRDLVTWNTLIAGYTQQGEGEKAIRCFECMQDEGIHPDVVTFSCMLNVCSHLGLVEEGHRYFMSMNSEYGVKPNLELFTCMIDMLGRAGLLEKALGVIHEMQAPDCSAIWHVTLAACLKRGDFNVGRWAFEQALKVDRTDKAAYILMANIYAVAGMHEKARDIDMMRMEFEIG